MSVATAADRRRTEYQTFKMDLFKPPLQKTGNNGECPPSQLQSVITMTDIKRLNDDDDDDDNGDDDDAKSSHLGLLSV